jgi:hypothetical protein
MGAIVRTIMVGLAGLLLAVPTLAWAGPAGAGTALLVAEWDMNELPGSTVLADSGPNGLDGTIGTSISLNGSDQTFPPITRGTGGTVDPQHLDTIYSDLLNPGTSDFIVTVRLRIPSVAASLGNVMQKGQTGTPGGFWKIQLDGGAGRVLCSFVSPTGSGSVRSAQIVADNQWHTVTCERTATEVSTTVDGVASTIKKSVGDISNNQPLSIGGKHLCSATPHHDCDYFIGSIDYVQVQVQAPAPYETRLVVTPRSQRATTFGESHDLTGQLLYTSSTGELPVPAGATVVVEKRAAATTAWTAAGTVTTSGTPPSFMFTDSPSRTTDYRLSYAGDATYGSSALTFSVGVQRAVTSQARIVRTGVNRGSLELVGHVAPRYAHRPVLLIRRRVGQSCAAHACAWLSLSRGDTSATSRYLVGRLVPRGSDARYCLAVEVPGNSAYLASRSSRWLDRPAAGGGRELVPANSRCRPV